MEDPSTLEAQSVPEKPRRFLPVVVVILAVLVVAGVSVYAWYAVYGPCTRGTVKTASAALFNQVEAFQAAYQSASSRNPIDLVVPVTIMQQTIWDTEEIPVPACMQAARNELNTAMVSAVRGYLAIMAGEPETTIESLMQDSRTHLEKFTVELDAVNRCAPFCL